MSDGGARAGQDKSTVAEASMLINKPIDVDYSDLASFLMDSFDARQVNRGRRRSVGILPGSHRMKA